VTTNTGVRGALRLLSNLRGDASLRERVSALDPDNGVEAVAAIAVEAGFSFSVDDLRAAFMHDWGMRRARQLSEAGPVDRAASTVAVVNNPPLSI
jgi:hypothetical protein